MKIFTCILTAVLGMGICMPFVAGKAGALFISEETKPIQPIDINRATEAEFAELPGIGPELARRIVAFREKHGAFRRVEDLLVIRGMGRKKWKAIRPYLKVAVSEEEN